MAGILEVIRNLFSGGSAAPDFAGHDPDDVEQYWRLDHVIDEAEREGEAALQRALQEHGFKNLAHWERVKGNYCLRHAENPDFNAAAVRVQTQLQMAAFSSSFQAQQSGGGE